MPFSVRVDRDTGTLVSSVQGVLSIAEVEEWRAALDASTAAQPAMAEFRFLSDFYDYDMADQPIAVHRRLRDVTPRFLAAHGFTVGFWTLDGVAPPPRSRVGTCTRVAHVHHDCRKMQHYDDLLASPDERFFCHRADAHAWLQMSRAEPFAT